MKKMIRALGLAGLTTLVGCTEDNSGVNLLQNTTSNAQVSYAEDKPNVEPQRPRDNTQDTIEYLAKSVSEFAKGFGEKSNATLANLGRSNPEIIGSTYRWAVGEGREAITVEYIEKDPKSKQNNVLHITSVRGDFNIRDEGLDGFQKPLIQTPTGYNVNKIKGKDQAEFWEEKERISYTGPDGAVINKNVERLNSKYKEILRSVLNR